MTKATVLRAKEHALKGARALLRELASWRASATLVFAGIAYLAWSQAPEPASASLPPLVAIVDRVMTVGVIFGFVVLGLRWMVDALSGNAMRGIWAPVNLFLLTASASALLRQHSTEIDALIAAMVAEPGQAIAVVGGIGVLLMVYQLASWGSPSSVTPYSEALHDIDALRPRARNRKKDAPLSAEERWRVGVHEAGHLVMYGVLAAPPDDLRVEVFALTANDGARGRVSMPNFSASPTRVVGRWLLLRALAGAAAEKHVFGEFGPGSDMDMDQWSGYARQFLEGGYAGPWYREPIDAAERGINWQSLSELKEHLLAELAGFMAANDALVREIATTLQSVDVLEGAALVAYLQRTTMTSAIGRTSLGFTPMDDDGDGITLRIGSVDTR